MTCRRISSRARAEQNYYLRIDNGREPTEQERLDWLHYDSHGGSIDRSNPLFVAKSHYGMYVAAMRESRFSPGWLGGYWLVAEQQQDGLGLRFLLEAFGSAVVAEWQGGK